MGMGADEWWWMGWRGYYTISEAAHLGGCAAVRYELMTVWGCSWVAHGVKAREIGVLNGIRL